MTNQEPRHAAGSTAVEKAWRSYHKAVDDMRAELYGSDAFSMSDPLQVNHYVAQIQAFAYHQVMSPRQKMPVILGPSFFSADAFRMGMQSPNFLYRGIYLDGSLQYRLFGKRGKTLFNQILVMKGGYNDPAPVQIGEYDLDALVRKDGSYDILVGGEGAQIDLDPASGNNWLFMRECFQSWDVTESGDDMDIEPVNPYATITELPHTDDEVIKRISGAERLIKVLHATASWPHFKPHNFDKTGPHSFSPLVHPKAAAYNPAAHYLYALYQLESDEALIVEADGSSGFRFWDICNCDVWGQHTNFIYRQSSLTCEQAAADPDGRTRIVVCPQDPGVPNWLDTGGFLTGTLMWRWYWTKSKVEPACKVVKFSELRQHLPLDTQVVSADQRDQELRRRRRSFTRRYHHLL